METVSRVDELGRYANLVGCAPNASFQYVAYIEIRPDIPDILIHLFKGKSRRSRGNIQPFNTRQGINYLFGNTVTEIFVIHVATHIDEGQYGNAS